MKHTNIHTSKYYETVNKMMHEATSKNHALEILTDMVEMMKNGTFPK